MQVTVYALSRDLIVTGEYQAYERMTSDYPGQEEYFYIDSIKDENTGQTVELTCDRHEEIVVRAVLDKIYTQKELMDQAVAADIYEDNKYWSSHGY